jgi:hypothetical protein
MVITSLKLKLLLRRFFGPTGAESWGCLRANKEWQKSSMSQKIATMSRQNSEGNGFGDQTVDHIYHIPKEFCLLIPSNSRY